MCSAAACVTASEQRLCRLVAYIKRDVIAGADALGIAVAPNAEHDMVLWHDLAESGFNRANDAARIAGGKDVARNIARDNRARTNNSA